MHDFVDLLSKLVAIDSVNPDLVPGGVGEGEIARFVADWLGKAGLEVCCRRPRRGGPTSSRRLRGQAVAAR